MSTLSAILTAMAIGFLIGGAARWAVPGPDPMPFWLTVLIGLGGSLLGGAVVAGIFGTSHALETPGRIFTTLLIEIAAATLLVVGYRRLVQKRPIAGPGAYRFPTRGVGIERLRKRLEQLGVDPDKLGESHGRPGGGPPRKPDDAAEVSARLHELQEKHDRGEISDEEYEQERERLRRF